MTVLSVGGGNSVLFTVKSPGLAQRLPQTNLCHVFVGVNNQRRICGEKKMILEEVTVPSIQMLLPKIQSILTK